MSSHANLSLSDLTQHEQDTLRAYKSASHAGTAGSACFELNRLLRSGLCKCELPQKLLEVAETLDTIFARAPKIAEPSPVYRGVGYIGHMPLTSKGNCFRNFEFWSTTITPSKAQSFLQPAATKSNGAILELQLPVGFPAYNLETLPGAGGAEAEILLPRGILWEVIDLRPATTTEVSDYRRQKFEKVVYAALRPVNLNFLKI